MKKNIITLSALFLITSLTVSAQDDKKKEPATEKQELNGAKTTEVKSGDSKPAGGGTRMAISTKGAPATKSASGNSTNSKSKSTPPATISPNTNADGTPKSN